MEERLEERPRDFYSSLPCDCAARDSLSLEEGHTYSNALSQVSGCLLQLAEHKVEKGQPHIAAVPQSFQ